MRSYGYLGSFSVIRWYWLCCLFFCIRFNGGSGVCKVVTYHLWWLFSLGPELWISRAVWSALWLFEGKFRHQVLYDFLIKILVAWHQVASKQTFFNWSRNPLQWFVGQERVTYPLRTSAWEARHQAGPLVGKKGKKNGDPLTFSPHRLLAILAFFPQTESLFTNFNWRVKANTKEIFFLWALLLCSLREEFLTYQTTVSRVECSFDCLKERAGLIKMEGQPSKC